MTSPLHHSRAGLAQLSRTGRQFDAGAPGPTRFLGEVEIAARLNHSHIVSLFDS